MSTKYPQGIITPTPPYKSTTAKSFSGVWTLEQLANNFYYYRQAVQKSLRFRSSASAYLSRTFGTPTGPYKWTWSGWVKLGAFPVSGYGRCIFAGGAQDSGNNTTGVFMNTSNQLYLNPYSGGVSQGVVTTSAVYRDPSAWYHCVFVYDSANATAADRFIIYVNGIRQATTGTLTQNTVSKNNASGVVNRIGMEDWGTTYGFDGYMAEVNFIDGQALDPSYFGQISPITGVWSPAPYTGSYGTNGFYLKFSDTTSTTTLCYDYSGNSNNWTPNNISLTAGSTYDSMLDSPTNYDNGGNGVGNYAVLNPNDKALTSIAISNGNLTATGSATNYGVRGSFGVTSGSWYYEASFNGIGASGIGIATSGWDLAYVGDASGTGNIAYISNGIMYSNGVQVQTGLATYTSGDIVGVAYNVTSGSIQFYKNNVAIGTAVTGFAGLNIFPAVSTQTSTVVNVNFGQRPFAYTPPTGYKALNTQNLPAPSIQNGANYMAATLYTGNGATQSIVNAVNGVSFQPDFVWGKLRTTSSYHRLSDSVRGASLTLATNVTDAEVSGNGLVSFDAAGFSMNSSTNINQVYPYVAWQWKAGGTAVTNTAGSITSQVSANTTSGFAVVTYSGNSTVGATVGHGLGVAPSMIIFKSRNTAGTSWDTYHVALGATKYLLLDSTAAAGTSSWLNNTAPSSSVITLNNFGDSNASGSTYVAYCFAAIPGYSAFGSFVGNGSSDGPFIYCGFRPRWILGKNISTNGAGNWFIQDTSRSPYNAAWQELYPNSSSAETTSSASSDNNLILSNGFKAISSGGGWNQSGETYIYAAFAENPFNYSLAR